MIDFTIGVDIGTTGTKIVLLGEGGIQAQVTRETPLASPRPGSAEADPAIWLENVITGIRELVTTSGIDPRRVRALSTSGMVPAVVLVDKALHPTRPAILQNDARAIDEITEVAEELGAHDVVGLTGSPVSQQSVAPTTRWLQRNEPAAWRATRYLVGSYDWVLMSLGADPHVERNWALESGLFCIDGSTFEPGLVAARLEHIEIPRVLDPGAVAGSLTESIASATGILPGTPLVVGGADHVLSAYSAGVEDEGDVLIKLGGAGDILAATRSPLTDSRLYLDAHPSPGRWLPNGCMATSGSLIRWVQALLGGPSLADLDSRADAQPAAQVLCLPYFLGEKSPIHDPNLRGVFAGLHLGTTDGDIYRSVLEGIAYGFRHHFEVLRERGIEPTRVFVTNGGSRSRVWKQIHSEVLGLPLVPIVDHPGASLGAAIIAAVGTGTLAGWDEGARLAQTDAAIIPDADHVCTYDAAYHEWRQLASATAPLSHQISRRTRS